MLHGKTKAAKAAIRWLSNSQKGRILPSDALVDIKDTNGTTSKVTVLQALKMKHPEPHSPPLSTLLSTNSFPPRYDLGITGAHIQHITSHIQGSAGPSGTDANHWQDVILRYGAHSEKLRDSIAALVRCISNSVTQWDDIRALMACSLLGFDKSPGIRPIAVGESLRRIACKTVCMLTRHELEDVVIFHNCVKAGIEAAIHAVSDMFREKDNDDWGVLLVDASNAFNSINRQALLLNSRVLWPCFFLILIEVGFL
jgi:hypothetical protein